MDYTIGEETILIKSINQPTNRRVPNHRQEFNEEINKSRNFEKKLKNKIV